MIIKYEIDKFIKEISQIEIEDDKNVFIRGRNPYDGLNTYFGIWSNEEYIVIVTLISDRNVSYDYSLNKNIDTEKYIKKYLEFNRNAEIISKEEFNERLQKVISIIGGK